MFTAGKLLEILKNSAIYSKIKSEIFLVAQNQLRFCYSPVKNSISGISDPSHNFWTTGLRNPELKFLGTQSLMMTS